MPGLATTSARAENTALAPARRDPTSRSLGMAYIEARGSRRARIAQDLAVSRRRAMNSTGPHAQLQQGRSTGRYCLTALANVICFAWETAMSRKPTLCSSS